MSTLTIGQQFEYVDDPPPSARNHSRRGDVPWQMILEAMSRDESNAGRWLKISGYATQQSAYGGANQAIKYHGYQGDFEITTRSDQDGTFAVFIRYVGSPT